MRIVLQRVKYAKVNIDGKTVGEIGKGIMALVGINTGDNEDTVKRMLDKITKLRIFNDDEGKMNLSVADKGYGLLLVPNFTVYADARKGNRPSFSMGASPDEAKAVFEKMVDIAKKCYDVKTESGIFQADMAVELLNDGPVTILLDSDKLF